MRRILLSVCVLLLILAAGPVSASADYAAPGPFQAGWRQVTVSRPGGDTFTARLYYPATASGENTPYDAGAAPYPAVSFGHGYLTSRAYYQSTLRQLATWGYFVIATESGMELFPSHSAYAGDLLHCLSYLEDANADPASWLSGQVDVAHFGLAGHSMGGGASILAAARDARVVAVANLAAAETTPSAEAAMPDVHAAVRLIVGSDDGIVSPATTRAMFDNGLAPRQFASIQGGSHCGFLDVDNLFCDSGSMSRTDQLARTRRLLTEFFNLYLRGDAAAWRGVWGPETDGDTLVAVDLDSGLTLDPVALSGTTYIGAEAAYELVLTNRGPYTTSYTLLAEGHTWSIALSPAVTPALAPRQAATVLVIIHPPAGATPGLEITLVSARADRDGATRDYAWIEMRALEFKGAIARAGNALTIDWTAGDAACSYEVHRAAEPYFSPGAISLIATLPPGSSSTLDATPGVVGDPALNHFYLVRAVCGASIVDAGYLGEFDFNLVPGLMP